jgi:hypothetical protein
MRIPIESYLVPPEPPELPAEMIRVDTALAAGLPQTIELDRDVSVVVVVPSGLATAWRDADPSARLSAADDELAAATPDAAEPVGSVDRGRPRLLVLRSGTPVAWLPLVAGARRSLPDDGEQGATVELAVGSWDVRAGSMRGPGAFGSQLGLGWRRADRGSATFAPPPLAPQVSQRLEAEGS